MQSSNYPTGSAIREICKHGEEAMRTIRQVEYLEKLLRVNPGLFKKVWKGLENDKAK